VNRARLLQQLAWLEQRVQSGSRLFSPWDALDLLRALVQPDDEDHVNAEAMSVCAGCGLAVGHGPTCYHTWRKTQIDRGESTDPACFRAWLLGRDARLDNAAVVDAEAPPPERPPPRIEIVDGATRTPLSAEALGVALFAVVPEPLKGQVVSAALAVQAQLDQGQRIGVQVHRVLRPDHHPARAGGAHHADP